MRACDFRRPMRTGIAWAKATMSMRVRGACPNTEREASPRAAAPAMTVVPPTNERRDGANSVELSCG